MSSPYRVLFLCTGNCCRSQMAEAILKQVGGDRFDACSAGSSPAGYIHPLVYDTMEELGVPVIDQRSKSWNEFSADANDIILTLCDSAASEVCPNWPGQPASAHWPTPDPSFVPGGKKERFEYAVDVARGLKARIEAMTALPLDDLTPDELGTELARIGQA